MPKMHEKARAMVDLFDRMGGTVSGSRMLVETIDAMKIPFTLLHRKHPGSALQFVHANPAFVAMCAFTSRELRGRRPSMLQGMETDVVAARQFRDDVMRTGRGLTTLVNYRKDGSAYEVFVLGARLRFAEDSTDEQTLYLSCSFLVEEVTMAPPGMLPGEGGETVH